MSRESFIIDQRDEPIIEHRRVRSRRGGRPAALTISMTPMIDVVFLLLVYFMVATDFRVGEEVYRMDLPNREGVSRADPFRLDDEPLRISVISTGMGPGMYRLRLDGPYAQPQTFEELYDFLHAKQVNESNALSGSGAMFRPDHPIIIQPTRSTRWEHAIEALNAAARARYTNVTFAKPG